MTVDDLAQLCAGADHVSRNACRIYILGVTQGVRLGARMAAHGEKPPCVPRGTSADALEATIKSALARETTGATAGGGADAAQLIGATLASAFPCAKGNP
jgi:Rap1a immunity proteins